MEITKIYKDISLVFEYLRTIDEMVLRAYKFNGVKLFHKEEVLIGDGFVILNVNFTP